MYVLKDPDLLRDYMRLRQVSQSRLAMVAGCSRQFVWALLNDPTKCRTSGPKAARIERELAVLPGTLFVAERVRP